MCDANGITGYPTMVWFKDRERVRNMGAGCGEGATVCDAKGITSYPAMVWFKDVEKVRNEQKADTQS